MIILNEGGIEFYFEKQYWWALKADNDIDFSKVKIISNTKSSDIIGYYHDKEKSESFILFLEVKDFRTVDFEDDNYAKILENCYEGIPQKIRDSLACIANACRNSSHNTAYWQFFMDIFKANTNRICVLVWREHSIEYLNKTQTNQRSQQARLHKERLAEGKLAKQLSWLKPQLRFTDTADFNNNQLLDNLSVKLV